MTEEEFKVLTRNCEVIKQRLYDKKEMDIGGMLTDLQVELQYMYSEPDYFKKEKRRKKHIDII